MRLDALAAAPVAIWGFGREGRAAYQRLRAVAPDLPITIVSDNPLSEPEQASISDDPAVGVATAEALASPGAIHALIKSPGVSLYRAEVQSLLQRGIAVTSPTNIWFAEYPEARAIGITGTKGKSTTASLTAHLLRAAGRPTVLAGNIGRAPLDLPPPTSEQYWVIELSSYQTADLSAVPRAAVLINLYPEHVDWHGSTERYFADKLNLLRPGSGQRIALNYADARIRSFATGWSDISWFNAPADVAATAFRAEENGLYQGTHRLPEADTLPLPGKHNRANLAAALTALNLLDVDPLAGLGGLAQFEALPHRLQVLGTRDGVTYVNDSISTTPESTLAAVDALAPRAPDRGICLLIGGHDRRQDYSQLARRLIDGPVGAVVTMPSNGPAIAKRLRQAFDGIATAPQVVEAGDLSEAVGAARSLVSGASYILLSPAAPSYGAFRDFEERGKQFAELAGFAFSD